MWARAALPGLSGAVWGAFSPRNGAVMSADGGASRRFAAPARPRARRNARARAPPLVTIERVARDALVARAAGSSSGAGDDGVPAVSTPAAPVVLANVAPSAAAAASAATAPADDAPTRPSEPFVPTDDLLRFCEPPEANGGKRLKIAVLLSGGVDSSVALTLLKAAGHDCVAFYLQIWFQEDFRNYWDQCPWEDDLKVARGVCDVLDVPLEMVPLTNQYWDLVVSHSIGEISQGRTPNPDMLCNSRVKFGAFRDYLDEAHPGRFDRVASGHYAALDRSEANDDGDDDGGKVKLVMSGDAHKDQTYFLAHLSQRQLSRLSFPVGGLPKSRLREVAAAAGLPNAGRKDSQGICFLGKVKFSEFVAEHLGERPGDVLEHETGERIGTHRGFWFHTIGQRSGLGLSGGPWYVCAKNTDANIVYITRDYYSVDKERNKFRVGSFNWIAGEAPDATDGWVLGYRGVDDDDVGGGDEVGTDDGATNEIVHPPMLAPPKRPRTTTGASAAAVACAAASELYCKVRHGEKRYRCTLRVDEDGAAGSVVIDSHDQGLAAGQFAVFYDGEECLGCGVILEQPRFPGLAERDARHRADAGA